MKSLKGRAILGSVIWAGVTVLIASFGLARYLEYNLERDFKNQLIDRHAQVAVALASTQRSPDQIEAYINDPVYKRPLSGEYWQVANPAHGTFTSLSLVDGFLPEPTGEVLGEVEYWTGTAPDGSSLLGLWRNVEVGDEGDIWQVSVAASPAPLLAAQTSVRKSLGFAIALITMAGILGAGLLTNTILAPLVKLRNDVASRWDKEGSLDENWCPIEVLPLVQDINTLLERNAAIVDRSRRQAADLAHAIKTPSAIVRNELAQLRSNGVDVEQAQEALDRLDAQLKRSFARMRASNAEDVAVAQTDLDHSLGRMVRAFSALSKGSGKSVETALQPSLRLRMDASDFEEITGNLLDNALKWANSRIKVTAREGLDGVVVSIEDDGPGISRDDRRKALISGQRLDTSTPGTGLGLAIASDIAKAYGGALSLKGSQLGGLRVDFNLSTSVV